MFFFFLKKIPTVLWIEEESSREEKLLLVHTLLGMNIVNQCTGNHGRTAVAFGGSQGSRAPWQCSRNDPAKDTDYIKGKYSHSNKHWKPLLVENFRTALQQTGWGCKSSLTRVAAFSAASLRISCCKLKINSSIRWQESHSSQSLTRKLCVTV